MRFLNSLNDRLAAMEREMQALPEELDSIVRRLDRGKWKTLLLRVNKDFNKLLDKLSTPQSRGKIFLSKIIDTHGQSPWHYGVQASPAALRTERHSPTGIARGTLPYGLLDLQPLSITPITDEDSARWRAAYKSEVRVVIGEGKVEVMAASELAGKYKTTVSQIAPVARKQGYIVLSWDQYIKLLDEIGKLIGE